MATAAIIGITTALSYNETRKARKMEQQRDKVRQRQEEVKVARERRMAVAEGRRLTAQTISQGVNQGVGGGSSVAGASGAVMSQMGGNIGFSQTMSGFNKVAAGLSAQANQHFGNAQTWQAVGSIASAGYETYQGWKSLGKKTTG